MEKMDAPSARETKLDTLRLRLPKIDNGTRADAVRRSMTTNTAIRTKAAARVPSVLAEVQPQLVLLTSANTVNTRPAVSVMAPGMSNPRSSSSARECVRMKKLASTTTEPIGTLT